MKVDEPGVEGLVAEARRLDAIATPGPWEWWTSNSRRRLTGPDGKDGGVLDAYVAHDGVPDVVARQADMAFVAAARSLVPRMAEALAAEHDRRQAAEIALDPALAPNIVAWVGICRTVVAKMDEEGIVNGAMWVVANEAGEEFTVEVGRRKGKTASEVASEATAKLEAVRKWLVERHSEPNYLDGRQRIVDERQFVARELRELLGEL